MADTFASLGPHSVNDLLVDFNPKIRYFLDLWEKSMETEQKRWNDKSRCGVMLSNMV